MLVDQNGIYISRKQASVTAAVLVILAILLFIGGYFWGKQSSLDGFTQKTSQESFNDQVDYLLTMQSFAAKNGGIMPAELDDEKVSKVEGLLQSLPDALEERDTIKNDAQPVKYVAKPSVEKSTEPILQKTIKLYPHYAILVGFSKKASAEQFAQRLKQHHIPVIIKTKIGKSSSGKSQRTWYQVITMSYEFVQEVQQIIDKILEFENIKRSDIKIV